MKNIKKVVLVETGASDVHVYSKIAIPRLGSVLLGTILRDQGYDVRVYIEDMAPLDWSEVLSADLVGISTVTATAPRSYALARRIREAGIPVVLGGIHATFEPEEAASHGDYVLRGEAEESLLDLIRTLEDGGSLEAVPGISFQRDGVTVHGPDVSPVPDLDRLPIPDFRLVQGWRRHAYVSVMTGRGCPFECTFCSVPAFNGHGGRFLSPDRVLDEIAFHRTHSRIRYLFFADDIFNMNRRRMKEILEGMIRRRLTPLWGAQVRHELSRDDEALELMRRANCDRVYVGFESINPGTLAQFKKHETRADIERAIAAFHRHHVKVHGMFVVGSDADTGETIQETERFARQHRIDSLQLMILTPIPGSKDYRTMVEGGRLFTRDWSLFDGHHAVHEPERMTAYEVQAETMRAMRRFYSVGQMARRAVRADWKETVIRFRANGIVRTFFRHNGEYLDGLRERLREQWSVAGTRLRSVGLPKLSEQGLRPVIEHFFAELNVAVVQVLDNAHDLITEGRTQAGRRRIEAQQALGRALERLRGRVDCVIVPIVHDDPEHSARIEVTGNVAGLPDAADLPAVVHVVASLSEGGQREMLTKLGLLVTDDLERIRRAVRKTLEAAQIAALQTADT
jgi:radical SAM superfamily enzyme YgiQ (UPF0313 family)